MLVHLVTVAKQKQFWETGGSVGEMWRKKVETVPTAFKDDVLVIQKHLMNINDKKERPKRTEGGENDKKEGWKERNC